jgi:multimeric flavodoxin WrbA
MRGLRRPFETDTVFLGDQSIRPCEACMRCAETGQCRIDDDMPALARKLTGADGVILASPVYMGGLTSRMRAFMERTWPLRRGQMAGKVGSGIVVGRRRIGVAAGAMASYFARLGMVAVPGILGYALAAGEIAQDEEAVREAQRLAQDLHRLLLMPGRAGAGGGEKAEAAGGR